MSNPAPTLPLVSAALLATVSTVAGLTALDYEPNNLQVSPAAYIIADRFDRNNSAAQITQMDYTLVVRVCVKWQDNTYAEAQLRALINPICDAVDKDPKLGGLLFSGMAKVTSGEFNYTTFGETLYRCCDISVFVHAKGAARSGI